MKKPATLVFLGLAVSIFCLTDCSRDGDRKIRLSSKTTAEYQSGDRISSSVLQVEPEQQRRLAILPFENTTSDSTLDWLRRGLADMLTTELSQSLYLTVVPIDRSKTEGESAGRDMAAEILVSARNNSIETMLVGSFYNHQGLEITVDLLDVESGKIIKSETVKGENLEQIFLMVNELSDKLRTNLRGTLESPKEANLKLAEMTESVEAFKCYSQALAYRDRFQYEKALECLDKATKLDSTFASAFLMLARLNHSLGKDSDTEALLQQARKFADKLSEPNKILLRMWEAEATGDIAELLSGLENLIKYEPSDMESRMQLAQLFKQLHMHDKAIEAYETIIQLDPSRKVAYNQLGYLYAERGEFNNALRYIDDYEQLAPDEPNPNDTRGAILMQAGRFREAITEYETALQKGPGFDMSASHLSDLYSEMDDSSTALNYSDDWLKHEDNPAAKPFAYAKHANLLWRFGKLHEAREVLQKARNAYPGDLQILLLMRDIYAELQDSKSALEQEMAFLDYLRNAEVAETLSDSHLQDVFRFCFESRLPFDDLSGLLTRVVEKEQRAFQKTMLRIDLALFHMKRGKKPSTINNFLDSQKDLLDLIAHAPVGTRSKRWKYFSMAAQGDPQQDNQIFEFFGQMRQTAKESGRYDIEVLTQYIATQYLAQDNAMEKMESIYKMLGTPVENRWRIIGPFENRAGFHKSFPPEELVDLTATYSGNGESVRWQSANDGVNDGYVDLRSLLRRSSWSVGYGAVNIHSPEERKVQIRLSSDEACKVWLNSKLIWQVYRQNDVHIDNDIVSVVLRAGDNKILIKVVNSLNDWGYYFRVTDQQGKGFPDIEFTPIDDKPASFALQ